MHTKIQQEKNLSLLAQTAAAIGQFFTELQDQSVVFVVGPLAGLPALIDPSQRLRWVRADIGTLALQINDTARPDMIVSPLLSQDSDILDTIAILQGVTYTGKLLVLAPPLPNPHSIQQEILAECDGMDVILYFAPAEPSIRR